MTSKSSLSALEVRKMLASGVARPEIVRQLIDTGVWSKAGAQDIVQFMSRDSMTKQGGSPHRANPRARLADER